MNEWIPVIIAFVAAVPGLIALIAARGKTDAEARLLDTQITEKIKVLAREEIARLEEDLRDERGLRLELEGRLDNETRARVEDRRRFEEDYRKLETELQNERTARGMLQDRILAMESELKAKDARIRELESGSGGRQIGGKR